MAVMMLVMIIVPMKMVINIAGNYHVDDNNISKVNDDNNIDNTTNDDNNRHDKDNSYIIGNNHDGEKDISNDNN